MATAHIGVPAGTARATERIVRQLLEAIPRQGRRGNVLREEISGIVASCLDLVSNTGVEPVAGMGRIRRAAARWAGVGVPIDTVQRLVQEGFRLHLDDHLHEVASETLRHTEIRRLMAAMSAVNATVSTAYLDLAPPGALVDGSSVDAVARALLGGRRTSKIAREYGMPVADRYIVFAVAVDDLSAVGMPGTAVPQHLRTVLATRSGQPVPALLSSLGGTILVPAPFVADRDLHDLIAATPLIAAAVSAAPEQIPSAADDAHELLDMVQRLYGRPGLYHFEDLALEYQLTRPGPGRDRLIALLDPLADHPELLQTLREYLSNNLNRRLTSRALHIHRNTIDHRLKRIGQLTGLDATGPAALWRLRAALIAHSYTHPGDDPAPG
ncbi:helix-turn-helix domain-containing protein [Nocardia sp. NPDC050710]|uniref:PucR family transcriptional regulator n=1 Tax=Nocardia sp. NPDC050710 TaxID=3157220 RepID=UPI00340B9A89